MFTDKDIVDGTVQDVFEHPERFILERDRRGNPLKIIKKGGNIWTHGKGSG